MSRRSQHLVFKLIGDEPKENKTYVLRGEPTKLDKKRRRNKRRKAGRHA